MPAMVAGTVSLAPHDVQENVMVSSADGIMSEYCPTQGGSGASLASIQPKLLTLVNQFLL
jgi:hypothetical protein